MRLALRRYAAGLAAAMLVLLWSDAAAQQLPDQSSPNWVGVKSVGPMFIGLVMLLVGVACARAAVPSTSSTDQTQPAPRATAIAPAATATVVAAPAATVASTSSNATHSRFAQPLGVWGTPVDAYLSQYPDLTSTPPRCTIPPNTDVQVLSRDVGFRLMILDQATRDRVSSSGITGGDAGEDVAQVAGTDGTCSGFVPASALQRS